MMADWFRAYISNGGFFSAGILAIIMFRHFNRVSTWKFLQQAFSDDSHQHPDWSCLEEELRSGHVLHKAHARPVTVTDSDRKVIGQDTVENAVLTFKRLWKFKPFQRLSSLLQLCVDTPQQYKQLLEEWESMRLQFKGAFGTYRFKNNLDVWVHLGAVKSSSLCSFPVALGAGTCLSLAFIYRCEIKSEVQAEGLLVHLWHTVRARGHFKTSSDSLATLALNLCGYHRLRYTCSHGGKQVSGLDRAISQEELEFLMLRRELRDDD